MKMNEPVRSSNTTAGMTLIELMIALVIVGFVLLAAFSSSTALQRGFGYTSAWSEGRANQTRLLDSLAVDLRNATKIVPFPSPTPFVLPITLTIPRRYSAYYRNKTNEDVSDPSTSDFRAGDPTSAANPTPAPSPGTIISRSGSNIKYSYDNTIDVQYALSADRIRITRTITRGTTSKASRDVATFPNGATVKFSPSIDIKSGIVSPTSIITSITTRPDPDYLNPDSTAKSTLEDRVFLRQISTQLSTQ